MALAAPRITVAQRDTCVEYVIAMFFGGRVEVRRNTAVLHYVQDDGTVGELAGLWDVEGVDGRAFRGRGKRRPKTQARKR